MKENGIGIIPIVVAAVVVILLIITCIICYKLAKRKRGSNVVEKEKSYEATEEATGETPR